MSSTIRCCSSASKSGKSGRQRICFATACATGRFAALAEGSNINYDGPSGTMAIDLGGNMSRAEFERFEFDDNGRDVAVGSIVVGTG